MGGFFGHWTSIDLKPFLVTVPRYNLSTKLLREYGNMASNKSWGYHSRRIANENFYPTLTIR
ncbi:hypothetical protein INT45_013385 [Circinella minor]|uniref:Uncharacterized protein n=1 Tax=Circinella minor TaxID=1195481 RepID=A0A8H7VKP6_9FUNG|nr:hypothetical protein INT45_013385 [Circinella minor]